MLVDGPGLDAARLRADVGRAVPGGSVTLRAAALGAMTGAPVPRAAQVALAQGMAAAAGFGALVLLLSLLLSARTRDMTLARMATMGLRRWQAQLMLVAETLPEVVAAAIGGVACAWLLVPLIGPSVNLAAFTGGPGRHGGFRPVPAGRHGHRAGAGLAAFPGRPGRGQLPPRQLQGSFGSMIEGAQAHDRVRQYPPPPAGGDGRTYPGRTSPPPGQTR